MNKKIIAFHEIEANIKDLEEAIKQEEENINIIENQLNNLQNQYHIANTNKEDLLTKLNHILESKNNPLALEEGNIYYRHKPFYHVMDRFYIIDKIEDGEVYFRDIELIDYEGDKCLTIHSGAYNLLNMWDTIYTKYDLITKEEANKILKGYMQL